MNNIEMEAVGIRKTLSLRIVKPVNIDTVEFEDLLSQLQRTLVALYNQASDNLWHHLQDPDTRIKRGNESAIVQQWTNEKVYRPIYDAIYSSYLALGMKTKLQSSFSGKKIWDIKSAESAPPFMLRKKLPLCFNIQSRLKVIAENDEFVVDIPFPAYIKIPEPELDKYKPWQKFKFIKSSKKSSVQLLLSTKNRKKNNGWEADSGTEAEIMRVIDGTYKISSFELIQKDDKWNIHLSIAYKKEIRIPDKSIIGGIHAAIGRPFTCAIHNNKFTTLSLHPNMVMALTQKQLARIREQRIGNRYRKSGHGKKHKLKGTEYFADSYRQRRKKIMESWVKHIVDFYIYNGAGIVYLENFENKHSFLSVYKFPVSELLERIKLKLEQKGVEVRYQKTLYINQICSSCGELHAGFTYAYRKKYKFPNYKCPNCKATFFPERNAANNVANPDYEKLLKKHGLLQKKK